MKSTASLLLAGALIAAPVLAQTSQDDLLKEIETLREQVSGIDSLKNRLDKLEKQLEDNKKAAASAPKPAAPPVYKITGYVQARFENNLQRDPHTDFYLRRARLKVQADPTPNASVVLQWDGAGANVTPLDAYVDLKTKYGGYYLRAGQFKVPFGYESLYESSNTRLAPERTRVYNTLFPGSVRERGIYLVREAKGKPSFYIGAVNGNNLNRDNNNDKDYVAHVEVPIGTKTSVGVSGYTGDFTVIGNNNTRTDTDRDRYGANVQALVGPVDVHAEYIGGKNLGANVKGGYVQAAVPTAGIPGGTPFVKYDWFDPNTGKAEDKFTRWTFGYAYDLDKSTRLTLAHEAAKDQATTGKDDITTFQVQVKF